MEHSFDVKIAAEYGIECAILLKNIFFWVEKNRANGKHFYDDAYWTYNSVKAFSELFPYITEKKIRTALKKLESCGLIKTGNYNKSAYDRTTWYTVTDEGKSILLKENFHLPSGKMEDTKKENEFTPKGEPIPDINTVIETHDDKTQYINKGSGRAKPKNKRETYVSLIDDYTDNEQLREALVYYVDMRLENPKDAFTPRALQLAFPKLDDLSNGDMRCKIDIVNQSVEKGWKGFFKLRDEKENGKKGDKNESGGQAEEYKGYVQRLYEAGFRADFDGF